MSENLPLVSVIIPTYNRVDLLKSTLGSILSQTYINWECLVIDDGSSDNTEEILQEYSLIDKRFKYFKRPLNRKRGGNAARNYGFEVSAGEFIHWFDSDDLMNENNLQLKVDFLQKHKLDCCVSQVAYFQDDFEKSKLYYTNSRNKVENNLYEEYITGRVSILNVTPLWRRSILVGEKLYDENIFQLQDLDFFSRIFFKNQNIGFLNERLVYVRRNNDSISTNFRGNRIDVPSFLEVKNRIICRTPFNRLVIEYSIKTVLWVMRLKMAKREYKEAGTCLRFCNSHRRLLTTTKRINLLKVNCFYFVFKVFRKGDTKFKGLLKI